MSTTSTIKWSIAGSPNLATHGESQRTTVRLDVHLNNTSGSSAQAEIRAHWSFDGEGPEFTATPAVRGDEIGALVAVAFQPWVDRDLFVLAREAGEDFQHGTGTGCVCGVAGDPDAACWNDCVNRIAGMAAGDAEVAGAWQEHLDDVNAKALEEMDAALLERVGQLPTFGEWDRVDPVVASPEEIQAAEKAILGAGWAPEVRYDEAFGRTILGAVPFKYRIPGVWRRVMPIAAP